MEGKTERRKGLKWLPWVWEGMCWSCSKCKTVNQPFQEQCCLNWYSLKVTREFHKYYNHRVTKHPSNVHSARLKTFNTSQDYSKRRISNDPESNVIWILPDPNRRAFHHCWLTRQTVMQWPFQIPKQFHLISL